MQSVLTDTNSYFVHPRYPAIQRLQREAAADGMAKSAKTDMDISAPIVDSHPGEEVIGHRMHSLSLNSPCSRNSVYEGVLHKRCRLSWRPRIVEVIRDIAEYSAAKHSYQLLIFDPRKRTLKDRIAMEDIVTIRASRDCYFQIYLSQGKILQFRAENTESQAYWMALIKVGLGRGSIFHVRIHTSQKGLEHALLYSIGVNLPAHRVGQLDRVLVLASPVNDINMQAWDLNRVKRFVQLDIGIQMELCSSCMLARTPSITFIVDKLFHHECIQFLCREAHVSEVPIRENGLLIFPVNHRCARPLTSVHEPFPQPPSYDQSRFDEPVAPDLSQLPPKIPPRSAHRSQERPVWLGSQQSIGGDSSSDYSGDGGVPPRNITRKNFESAIPAVAHPYTNFQPHLFNQSGSNFESPYQISSRIIITNTGKVQYERNVLGNKKQNHGGFHFKRQIPLPPRHTHVQVETQVHCPPEPPPVKRRQFATPPQLRRASDPQWERTAQFDKRCSEISDCDDAYIFIAPGAMTPPISTNRSASPSIASESYSQFSGSNQQLFQSSQNLSDNPPPNVSPRLPRRPRPDEYDDVVLVNVSQEVHVTPYGVTTETNSTEGDHMETERQPEVAPKLPVRTSSLSPQRRRKPAIIPRKNVNKPTTFGTQPFLSLDDSSISHRPNFHRTLSIHEAHTSAITNLPPQQMTSDDPSHTSDHSAMATAGEDNQVARGHMDFASASATPLPASPKTPPTPKPRNRVRFIMTAVHSDDDSSTSSGCVHTAETRTRSVSTPVEPEALHIAVSDV